MRRSLTLVLLLSVAACGRMGEVGKAPAFTPTQNSSETYAMMTPGLPQEELGSRRAVDEASLWSAGRQSLLGDHRASKRGDILTVVIEIDEKAEISNTSQRSRSGSENMGIGSVFGLDRNLPDGISLDPGIEINSGSKSSGNGSVRRNERLELRVAATVVDVLQNGVLQIQGSQEVRVNFEMRELLVTGYVRPEDISRANEITYDRMASARISYGGRGQITEVQQPRYGQQVIEKVLPF
jgi:flagellar L-ring protein FlgH